MLRNHPRLNRGYLTIDSKEILTNSASPPKSFIATPTTYTVFEPYIVMLLSYERQYYFSA
jgi:hypothetical protein